MKGFGDKCKKKIVWSSSHIGQLIYNGILPINWILISFITLPYKGTFIFPINATSSNQELSPLFPSSAFFFLFLLPLLINNIAPLFFLDVFLFILISLVFIYSHTSFSLLLYNPSCEWLLFDDTTQSYGTHYVKPKVPCMLKTFYFIIWSKRGLFDSFLFYYMFLEQNKCNIIEMFTFSFFFLL